MRNYNFNQHRHNYAVWTASRAVQRGFTTTAIIKNAIENSGLRQFSEANLNYQLEDFKSFHKTTSRHLINSFKALGILVVNYGRAAKIIAIYLKTSIILCNKGKCSKSKIIHPPIDGILLRKMSKIKELHDLKFVRWTNLEEKDYWELVSKIEFHF